MFLIICFKAATPTPEKLKFTMKATTNESVYLPV